MTRGRPKARAATRWAVVAAAAVMVSPMLSACVTPAFTHGAYQQNAKSALESAASETATGALAVRTRLSDRATNAYADTVVTESEQAMGGIEASFGGVDPPTPAQDGLRYAVGQLLGDASDALATARIAVRRDNPAAMRDAASDLDEVTRALDQAREKLR